MPAKNMLKSIVGWVSNTTMALLLTTGCVTYQEERVSPQRQTTLTVARVEDAVSLQFPSQKGVLYTILFTTNLNSGQWTPLPNGKNILGTGELLSLEDRVPDGSPRYYRLQVDAPKTR